MTKAEEIAALHAFIQSMPRESYLRPWLEDIAPTIEKDLAGDMIPFVSPQDIREEATKQHAEYKAQLAALHEERDRQQERTRDEAARIITEARKHAEDIETRAKRELAADIHRLQTALANLTI
jgi:hypothetical protein